MEQGAHTPRVSIKAFNQQHYTSLQSPADSQQEQENACAGNSFRLLRVEDGLRFFPGLLWVSG